MHIRTILAIARKDMLDTLLNKSALIVLISPLFFAVVFSLLNGVTSSRATAVLIYNPGNSGVERVVSGAFSGTSITHTSAASDVTTAFGANGTHKIATYALGLVVPPNFDADLRAGKHPQLLLFINGNDLSNQQEQVLQQLLTDYARTVVNPQSPASVAAATINPPASSDLVTEKGLFVMFVLLSSLMVGTSIVPGLLVEEKERKTLRMLMVSPASFSDIVAGKLLVGLAYQVLVSLLCLVILQGFIGDLPLLLCFGLLGAAFSIGVGLLGGSIFQSTAAMGGFIGFISFIYVIPSLFVGVLGQLLQGNPIVEAMQIFPTYYLADGVYKALIEQSTPASTLLDAGVTLGCAVALFLISVWILRRQATVVSTI